MGLDTRLVGRTALGPLAFGSSPFLVLYRSCQLAASVKAMPAVRLSGSGSTGSVEGEMPKDEQRG